MAIYHFSASVIGRGAGRSSVAAAAYRSASRLHDQRLDRAHDFSNKAGVVHSEVMLPEGAQEHLSDRATLWNEVEASEVRKDAQLAREIEFAIPREMKQGDGIALARDIVQQTFVDRGMIADLNVHWDVGADGEPKPHAHVMLTMREVGPDGFGAKVRDWNATALLQEWREAWSAHANERMAELGIEARIDHRSFADQGIDLEPQNKIGAAASRSVERGQPSERAAEHAAIARDNGERILAYEQAGLIRASETREAALIVSAIRRAQLILSHTRDEVRALNEMARDALKQHGTLGPDVAVKTERGERLFAVGDRIMFLRNDRDLGIKNGTLATVEQVSKEAMAVRLDDGRSVGFDLKSYSQLDHGYAATVHKAQGVTVDRTYILATPGLDSHATYVGLSRHRDGVQVHYGKDDFATPENSRRCWAASGPRIWRSTMPTCVNGSRPSGVTIARRSSIRWPGSSSPTGVMSTSWTRHSAIRSPGSGWRRKWSHPLRPRACSMASSCRHPLPCKAKACSTGSGCRRPLRT